MPEATRSAGLARLRRFLPRAGEDYARTRNFDRGPGAHDNVSGLSPWIRLRLIRESEVVAAAVAAHGHAGARKFIEEVCWRTYFKGWLELRPAVWSDYRDAVTRLGQDLDADAAGRERWRRATTGQTGIDCFDAWVRELVGTGYLHNHARMWFASIWVFTLDLPWQLGADFFLRHLLDGDPASNTLSWRWVVGLHTRGRSYLALGDNIRRYTDGRFDPGGQLRRVAPTPVEDPPPDPRPPPRFAPLPEGRRLVLLLTEEDLHPESLGIPGQQVTGVAAFSSTRARAVCGTARGPVDFALAALGDALRRAGDRFGAPGRLLDDGEAVAEAVADFAAARGAADVAVPWPPVGPARDRIEDVARALRAGGLSVWPLRRRWDESLWPAATGGFFGFRKRAMPMALRLAATTASTAGTADPATGPTGARAV